MVAQSLTKVRREILIVFDTRHIERQTPIRRKAELVFHRQASRTPLTGRGSLRSRLHGTRIVADHADLERDADHEELQGGSTGRGPAVCSQVIGEMHDAGKASVVAISLVRPSGCRLIHAPAWLAAPRAASSTVVVHRSRCQLADSRRLHGSVPAPTCRGAEPSADVDVRGNRGTAGGTRAGLLRDSCAPSRPRSPRLRTNARSRRSFQSSCSSVASDFPCQSAWWFLNPLTARSAALDADSPRLTFCADARDRPAGVAMPHRCQRSDHQRAPAT